MLPSSYIISRLDVCLFQNIVYVFVLNVFKNQDVEGIISFS